MLFLPSLQKPVERLRWPYTKPLGTVKKTTREEREEIFFHDHLQ